MSRPEKPLGPKGPVTVIAGGLRQLRQDAGSPRYRDLAVRAGVAASTLSKAAAGDHLPSLEVTLAYVRACGGDEKEWEQRWRTARTLLRAPVGGASPTPPASVALPDVRVGASTADPGSATTPREFTEQMRILRIHAGKPSYAKLGRRIGAAASTVHAALHNRGLPALWLVQAFAAACDDDPQAWTETWRKIAISEERRNNPPERAHLRLVEGMTT